MKSVLLNCNILEHTQLSEAKEIVTNNNPCLIFVNSRNSAETVSQRLQSIAPDLKIEFIMALLQEKPVSKWKMTLEAVHHFKGLFAHRAFELGIDVGSVNHVVQINSHVPLIECYKG